jgi:uncharacterized protein with FMN-binding domain
LLANFKAPATAPVFLSSSIFYFLVQYSIMVQINEVKSNSRENRTAAHTHIKGLGLRSDGTSEASGDGFVGQATAREVSDSSRAMNAEVSLGSSN